MVSKVRMSGLSSQGQGHKSQMLLVGIIKTVVLKKRPKLQASLSSIVKGHSKVKVKKKDNAS